MLGFKHKGRGIEYYETHADEVDRNIAYLDQHLMENKNRFNGIGFDTLATLDLHMEEKVGPEKWALHNMGAEGEYTMFFDGIHNKYAISSMETELFDVEPGDTFDTIFHKVRQKAGHEEV